MVFVHFLHKPIYMQENVGEVKPRVKQEQVKQDLFGHFN